MVRVDFDADVRPLLSDRCFACHGPDAARRQAGLRLDTPEGLTALLPTRLRAVVPGRPFESALYQRITAPLPIRMPPAKSGKTLTQAEIATLRRWIEQGAPTAPHWAFRAPRRPALPASPPAPWQSWAGNPIDRFLFVRMRRSGLSPSPQASRHTLVRRVTLDLTGLPPTPEEVDAFVNDRRPDAVERLVNRLLASPHYGERMALFWLDLARYADTHGYHIDSHRDMWLWRDWVVRAFNQNMPYDRFVVEQLAGDLLPNATVDQRIATGFNRNHPINFEGGAIAAEYLAAYVHDRVDTTATTFLGITMRCAQCHDHKYDPISQKDYYRFYAFFNNVAEQGLDGQRGNAAPILRVPSAEQTQRLAALTRDIASVQADLDRRVADAAPSASRWATSALAGPAMAQDVQDGLAARLTFDGPTPALERLVARAVGAPRRTEGRLDGALQLDGNSHLEVDSVGDFDTSDRFSVAAWVKPADSGHMAVLSRMGEAAALRGWDLYLGDGRVFVHLIHAWEQNAIRVNSRETIPTDRWTHVLATYDGSGKASGVHIYINGRRAEMVATHDQLGGTIRTSGPTVVGRRRAAAPFRGVMDDVRIYTRVLAEHEAQTLSGHESIRQTLETPEPERSDRQRAELAQYYLRMTDAAYREAVERLSRLNAERERLDAAVPTTMVMEELPRRRITRVLQRGEYDKPGEPVMPGTPAFLPRLSSFVPPNRLALARWLVRPDHPLTARVFVNRIWQMHFGVGLVRTSEDFGNQSERPTHPELLDWLATEFVRTGWNVKALHRLIVTSQAYRQDARVSPRGGRLDPENRLLARGARPRLQAEVIRDQALAVSGLLVRRIGGPPVKPYQPPGIWEEMAFGQGFTAQRYEQDHGEALYRRSLYTFWKRTVPPPAMQVFDAPEREFCVVRRIPTNTPLQALALWNDPTYVEAARKLAERVLREPVRSDDARARSLVRMALARPATEADVLAIRTLVRAQRAAYRADTDAAARLLRVGESPEPGGLDAVELASWTAASSAVLSLDETITRG